MQHSIDEFSMSDIRHTLQEAWRVMRDRWLFFLFPFLGISTLALVASLWLPRQYAVSTIVQREQDPVLASIVGRNWTEAFTEIRQRMPGELSNPDGIERVLEKLKLPSDAERFAKDPISPTHLQSRRALAGEISAGLSTKSLEESPTRDVVAIRLVMNTPRHAAEILRELRDQYLERTQKRTTEILRSVEEFFLKETSRCRSQCSEAQAGIAALELKYPGINPDVADPAQAGKTALVIENVQLGRQIEELHESVRSAAACEGQSTAKTAATSPNPRYGEIKAVIEKLEQEIVEARTVKAMTPMHPSMQRLAAALETRQEELNRTPATIQVSAPGGEMTKVDDTGAKINSLERRIAANRDRIAKIEQDQASAVSQRDTYMKLKEKAARANEELAIWQQNIGPIKHILAVENGQHGVHFATVRDAFEPNRPCSPDPKVVGGLCLAIGAAFGIVVVLLAELLDRSFRTARGISSTLGLPVIESIDEILSVAARKQRMLRRYLVMPTVAGAMCVFMVLAGIAAYVSIDRPHDYASLRSSPLRMWTVLFR